LLFNSENPINSVEIIAWVKHKFSNDLG
jgi:hypothetical protein